MKQELMNKLGLKKVAPTKHYHLSLYENTDEPMYQTYPKAYDLCDELEFKTLNDVVLYVKKATEIINNEYNFDLECKVKIYNMEKKGLVGKVRIIDKTSNNAFICGLITQTYHYKILSFIDDEKNK